MKSNQLLSFLRHKLTQSILFCALFGSIIFLIWPSAPFEKDIFIPVKTENIPNGLTVSAPFTEGIDIRVSGPKSKIHKLKDLPLQYILDLSDMTQGTFTSPIHQDLIGLPPDISIIKINPSFLTIAIENEIIKMVPVNVVLSSKQAAGHMISKITTVPSSVTLKGPKSLLDPLKQIQTKPVDINNIFESFKKETALELEEGIQTVDPSEKILVEITVQKQVDTRVFDNIPVSGMNTPYTYHITPATVKIKVNGPTIALDKIDTQNQINVHIDLQDLQPGTHIQPAIIILPVDITLIQVEPEFFTIDIRSGPAAGQ